MSEPEVLNDGEAWSFCRRVIADGRDIATWHAEEGYERHSARMDAKAAQRGDELMAMVGATVATLRADRDSLRDALAALVQAVRSDCSAHSHSAVWRVLRAEDVLGEKRA